MEVGSKVEIEQMRHLLDRVSWPLDALGIWPKNPTPCGQLKFTIFMTYYVVHISMQFLDLVTILNNLELVVINLTESVFQLMVMFRILTIRFNKKTRRIINAIEEDLVIDNFRDPEEIRIFHGYSSIADKFYGLASKFGTATAVVYYVTPLQTYIIARIMNGTAVLVNPYRIYHFVDLSTIERTAIVYACQLPMIYAGVSFVTSYCILLAFVMNFCGQLAILTHRISTMKDDFRDPRAIFCQHTQRHIKVLVMTQWLNDAFQLPLLCDLLTTTVLLGLVVYQFLLHINDADVLGVFQLTTYIASMTVLVYINCFMGEFLNTECSALLNAYYEYSWYEMSDFYKKALIICMEMTQKPIQLTAGKFYVFSLQGFTQIMKSSMVYVSMLRTII